MTEPLFDFYFEESGRSASQGAIAPAEQFFEGDVESSVVRETAQNSIDARAGEAPVIMRFELADVRTDDVPGIATLRRHIAQVASETDGTEGHRRMRIAEDVANAASVATLKISDYGTLGLTGHESLDDSSSRLSALTRGAGVSASGDGSRGGSFGIGSAVGPMASDMSTVIYTSMTEGEETVFAAHSRLATHRDSEGVWRGANGFFTDLNKSDFSYLRSPGPVGPFDERVEPGTDIYILGYRHAQDDPRLEKIRRAFLENFLVAIHRGHLIVEGRTEHGEWRLDRDSLAEHARAMPDVMAFYRAITESEPVVTEIRRLGRVSLFVNIDDSLEKSLYTMTMRSPLMRVAIKRHNSIPVRYAAVLICEDAEGNRFLRSLEPPQHNAWEPRRARGGAKALDELYAFVGDAIRKQVTQHVGESIEIDELAKYLPAFTGQAGGDRGAGRPTESGSRDGESSAVHGTSAQPVEMGVLPRSRVRVKVRASARAGGDDLIEKGKDTGGAGKRSGVGGGLPGEGTEGSGGSKIKAGDISFRSWFDADSQSVMLVVTPRDDVSGELELAPLGPGGTAEEDYLIPIDHVSEISELGESSLEFHGNVISGLQLTALKPTRIRLRMAQDKRYRLAVR